MNEIFSSKNINKDFLELLNELSKQGLTLQPINRYQNAIKDEPKWRIAKLEDA